MLSYPSTSNYQHAITGQIRNLKTAAALKLCLAFYYHVEPVQTPRTPLWARIDTLFVLMLLLDSKLHNANTHVRALGPLPARARAVRIDVLFHLKAKVVSDTAWCFGEDSAAAKFEKKVFEDFWEKLEAMCLMARRPFVRYIPLSKSPDIVQKLVLGLTELMSWAELPTLTLKK